MQLELTLVRKMAIVGYPLESMGSPATGSWLDLQCLKYNCMLLVSIRSKGLPLMLADILPCCLVLWLVDFSVGYDYCLLFSISSLHSSFWSYEAQFAGRRLPGQLLQVLCSKCPMSSVEALTHCWEVTKGKGDGLDLFDGFLPSCRPWLFTSLSWF